MKLSIINIDPDIMGGTPVFRGTRVPIQALFDCLLEGNLEDFLYGFPTVDRQMAEALLAIAAKRVIPQIKKKVMHESLI